MLTDAEIDYLDGMGLSCAIAIEQGWTPHNIGGDIEWKDARGIWRNEGPPEYHRDEGAAFRLLLSTPQTSWSIECYDGMIGGPRVRIWDTLNGSILAEGTPDDAASVMLKAWLKLKNRGE